MMVSIYKRGKKLYLQYYVNEKRRQKSTGLEDTPANRKMLKTQVIPQLEIKIMNGDIDNKKPTLFKVYADKYLVSKDSLKTARELGHTVEKIVKKFGNRNVVDIKRVEVREYSTELLKDKSPKTVRNYIRILGAILELAIEYDEITDNPAEHIKLPKHIKPTITPFTPEEVERLIASADGYFKNFLAISFYTGMRTGEVLGLMHGDIDFDTMTIKVVRSVTKGKCTTPKTESGVRRVPIFSHLVPYLKEQMRGGNSLYLFSCVDGKHLYGASSLKRHWRRVCTKADVEYRKVYTTRHTFITSMLKSGKITILELAQMVGHSNTEPIMKNYAMFIEGEHLKINRDFSPFAVTIPQTPQRKALL
jgi:integrase